MLNVLTHFHFHFKALCSTRRGNTRNKVSYLSYQSYTYVPSALPARRSASGCIEVRSRCVVRSDSERFGVEQRAYCARSPKTLGNMAAADVLGANLVEGYSGLHQKVTDLLDNLLHLQSKQKKLSLPKYGVSSRIQAIFDGDSTSETSATGSPSHMRSLVRIILTFPEKAIDLVVADLEDHFHYMQSTYLIQVTPDYAFCKRKNLVPG